MAASRSFVSDGLLAAVLCAVDLAVFSVLGGTSRIPAHGFVIVAYAAIGYSALAWRRRAPVPVFVILWLHGLFALLIPGYRPTLGLLFALYTVAAWYGWRATSPALAAVLVTSGFSVAEEYAATTAATRVDALVAGSALYTMLDVAVWAVGSWAGTSRRRLTDLERQRREAVTAERARVARELHDIVAHAVTVMVLQAAGASRIVGTEPEQVKDALRNIEDAGSQAIAELRRLLYLLRSGEGDDESPSATHPGLADLQALLDRSRYSGMDLRCTVEGTPATIDPSVSMAAFRVIQEGITNAAKHAPGAPVEVAVRWDGDLLIQVTNGTSSGAVAREASGGLGLVGLAERMALVGGTFSSKPTPGGGFRVTATLPLSVAERA